MPVLSRFISERRRWRWEGAGGAAKRGAGSRAGREERCVVRAACLVSLRLCLSLGGDFNCFSAVLACFSLERVPQPAAYSPRHGPINQDLNLSDLDGPLAPDLSNLTIHKETYHKEMSIVYIIIHYVQLAS
jgi:hypothetical protein